MRPLSRCIRTRRRSSISRRMRFSRAITDASQDAVQQGINWGQSVAEQILAWRSQDGFSNTAPLYTGGTPRSMASDASGECAWTRATISAR